MGRKPRVARSPEEKCQIIQEGIKHRERLGRRADVTGTLRIFAIGGRMRAERGARAALGGRSAAAAETEKDHRIRQLGTNVGRKSLEIEILKNVVGE